MVLAAGTDRDRRRRRLCSGERHRGRPLRPWKVQPHTAVLPGDRDYRLGGQDLDQGSAAHGAEPAGRAGAHLETVGSIEGVAKAKGELVEALPATGTAILNRDDPNVAAMAKRTSASVLWFGTGGDISATNVVVGDDLRPTFDLNTPDGSKRVTLGVAGAHHVTNALAAAAIGIAIGVPLDRICVGLEAGAISPWRMELRTNVRGTKVLNDAYNANPTSMEAALRSLASLPADRRIAVMGTMAEVGESSGDEHARIGEVAQSLGLECLSVAEPSFGVANVDSIEAAASRLSDLGPGDAVLVKGSRVAGLERLAALLMAD